jgi:hypothetical protein
VLQTKPAPEKDEREIMTIVSNDSYEEQAAALKVHGYDAPPDPNAVAPSADPLVEQAVPPAEEITTDPVSETGTILEQAPGAKAPKKKQTAQERIDQISTLRYEEKARADFLEKEIGKLKAQIAGKPPETAAPEPPAETVRPERPKRPKQSEFDTTEELEAAMDAYDTKVAAYEDDLGKFNRAQAISEFQQKQAKDLAEARVAAIHEAGKVKYPDYENVVLKNNDIEISTALLDAIGEYDNAEDFFHYLGSNPDQAKEFLAETFTAGASMYTPRQARASARITAEIARELGTPAAVPPVSAPVAAPAASPVAPVVPVPPRQATSAPAPIKPLRSTSSTAPTPDPNRQIGKGGYSAADERATMRPVRR